MNQFLPWNFCLHFVRRKTSVLLESVALRARASLPFQFRDQGKQHCPADLTNLRMHSRCLDRDSYGENIRKLSCYVSRVIHCAGIERGWCSAGECSMEGKINLRAVSSACGSKRTRKPDFFTSLVGSADASINISCSAPKTGSQRAETTIVLTWRRSRCETIRHRRQAAGPETRRKFAPLAMEIKLAARRARLSANGN